MSSVIAVVGATASGKSDLGVELALRLGGIGGIGEVVNADSMQLYRGMDIGTAKISEAERRGVPHHLLDVLDVTEPANVADYQRDARARIDAVRAAGRTPILVGGSGLYIRAAIDRLEFPGTDPEIRARLEDEVPVIGAAGLHARLSRLDPRAAAAILPGNTRRIVRALEVIELTGNPFSATMPGHESVYPCVQIGLSVPRPELDERIEVRVDRMWAAGLVDEVRALDGRGLSRGRTASRALGYAQVLRQFAGEYDEAAAKEETVRATRRFARRQESWFRRDPRVHWLDHNAPDLAEQALALIRAAESTAGAAPR